MLPLKNDARSALVVVDMQNFFFRRPERRAGLPRVVANINRLIERFDECGLPVIHAVTRYRPDGSDWDLKMKAAGLPELIAGTPEAGILAGIPVKENHHLLVKTRYSAFFKTGLAEQLRAEQIDRLLVAGAYTHYCVNATVFDAYCHDFIPGLVTDAVISHLPDESQVIIARMRRNGFHLVTASELCEEMARSQNLEA